MHFSIDLSYFRIFKEDYSRVVLKKLIWPYGSSLKIVKFAYENNIEGYRAVFGKQIGIILSAICRPNT